MLRIASAFGGKAFYSAAYTPPGRLVSIVRITSIRDLTSLLSLKAQRSVVVYVDVLLRARSSLATCYVGYVKLCWSCEGDTLRQELH